MEWISIKDRMPKEGEKVIVFNGIMYIKCYKDGVFYEGEKYCYPPICKLDHVTHWMPLPEPPKD